MYKGKKMNIKVKIHSFDIQSQYNFGGPKSTHEDCIIVEAQNNISDFTKRELLTFFSEENFLNAYNKIS